MRVVQITPEIHPFTIPDRGSTEHLGQNIASLSHHLALRGHDVAVFSPLYGSIQKEEHHIAPANEKIWVTLQNNVYEFDIYKVSRYGVDYYFLSNNILFERRGIYGYGGMDFSDNDVRFGAFCQACMNYIAHHMSDVEVLHSHNWQAALVPIYSSFKHKDSTWKNVFTVHDLSSQGVFNRFSMETLGLPWDMYTMERLEFYDSVNLLKGGIIYSDAVTSLNNMHSDSLVSHGSGYGLDGVLGEHKDKLVAAPNGIDFKLWNPITDNEIFANYSADNIGNRGLNKAELCKKFGLDNTKPLFSAVSRYVRKHGVDVIMGLLPEILKQDINIFLLGKSEDVYVENLLEQQKNYPNLRVVDETEHPIFNLLMASSDFFIAPHMHAFISTDKRIAMRYGAIPITRAYAADKHHFLTDDMTKFRYYSADDLPRVLGEAAEFYKHKGEMQKYKVELMKYNSSWELSAERYEQLYKKGDK
jgi:starch synthase